MPLACLLSYSSFRFHPRFQLAGHGRRDERRDVAAHGCDLANKGRRDVTCARAGGQEDRLDVWRHRSVHAGHLHLVVEVRAVPQTSDDKAGAMFARGIDH